MPEVGPRERPKLEHKYFQSSFQNVFQGPDRAEDQEKTIRASQQEGGQTTQRAKYPPVLILYFGSGWGPGQGGHLQNVMKLSIAGSICVLLDEIPQNAGLAQSSLS